MRVSWLWIFAFVVSWSVAARSAEAQTTPRIELQQGIARLRVRGTAQLGTEIRYADAWSGNIDFRRLRLGVGLGLWDRRVEAQLQLSLMPRSPELIDAFVDVRLHEAVVLRAGIAKIGFTDYRQLSFTELVAVDWALTSRAFGSERQMGFSARGEVGSLHYQLGVYHGHPSRPGNARYADTFAVTPRTQTEFGNAIALDTPHPEFAGLVGYQLRPVTVTGSAAWDVRPERSVDAWARFALESTVKVEPFELRAIGYFALAENRNGRAGAGLGGIMTEATYRRGAWATQLRWSALFRPDFVREDARAWADERIAADPSLAASLANVGNSVADHELNAALAYSFWGDSLKLQTDMSWLRSEGVTSTRDSARFRLQGQLAF